MGQPKAFNLNYRIDAFLREIPEDQKSMRGYVEFVALESKRVKLLPPTPVRNADGPSDNARALVKLLGEIGSYSKILGDLKQAKEALERSLSLIEDYQLGPTPWAIHTLRFGDVLRREQDYLGAETAFQSVLEMSHRLPELRELEDFALQHLGKLAFDKKEKGPAVALFQKALKIRQQKKNEELIRSTELALKIAQALKSITSTKT